MSLPDIRLQMAAVTLAEELNFTRAAERLGITQPALSKRVVELETTVGFIIFDRVRRRIELTDAGQVFIRGCRDANSILERAIREARTARDEARPVLTFGHSPYSEPSLVSALLGIHLPLYPKLRLRIESMFSAELAHAVLSAELDLALLTEPTENHHLTLVQVTTNPLCVLMPSDHPAATKQFVTMSDFNHVGWMVWNRKSHSGIYDRLMEEARIAGVAALELHHYVNPQDCVQLVTENFGVAFVAKGIGEQLRGRDIVLRPLTHPSLQVTTYLALRAEHSTRLTNDFGRAFLRKVLPQNKFEESSGQLLLGL